MTRRDERPNYTNSLGITSIILGIVSLPFLCMPCVGYVGVGIGCVGMLLGIFGIVQSMGRGGHGIGYPIGGVTLSFLSAAIGVVILIFFAGVFALPFAAKKATDTPTVAPATVDSVDGKKVDPARTPSIGEAAELKDVRVTLSSVEVARVQYRPTVGNAKLTSDEEMTIVRVKIENRSESRIIKYNPWQNRTGFTEKAAASLGDEHGNDYDDLGWDRRRVDGASGFTDVYPGKSVDDVIVFKRPVGVARRLTLTLQGSRVGLSETAFKFEFGPDQFVGRSKAADVPVKTREDEPRKVEPKREEPKATPVPKSGPDPKPTTPKAEPEKSPPKPEDPTPARKAAYIRIAAAKAKVEAAAIAKFGRKPDSEDKAGFIVPYKTFMQRETNKALDSLADELGMKRAVLDAIQAEGDEGKWPNK